MAAQNAPIRKIPWYAIFVDWIKFAVVNIIACTEVWYNVKRPSEADGERYRSTRGTYSSVNQQQHKVVSIKLMRFV